MTPAEYLRQMQQLYEFPYLSEEEVSNTWPSLPKEELAQTTERINVGLSTGSGVFLEPFLERIPIGIRQLFEEGRLVVGIINKRSPGAHVRCFEDSGCAIIIHLGLIDFIYAFARAIATRVQFVDDPSNANNNAVDVSFDEMARILADLLWWYKKTGKTYFRKHPSVSLDQMHLAAALATEAEIFTLGHEVAHALCDQKIATEYIVLPSMDKHISLHEHEVAADVLGAQLALGLLAPNGTSPAKRISLAFAGAVLLFQALRTIHQLWPQHIMDSNETHPLPDFRIEVVSEVVRSVTPNERTWQRVVSISESIAQLIGSALQLIEDKAKRDSWRDDAAERLLLCLDRVAQGWNGIKDEDYYRRANTLLSEIKPSEGIAVLKFVSNFLERIRQTPTRGEVLKMRLLARAFVTLRDPAKSVYLEALKYSEYRPDDILD
jgi:hypothetical protein